MCQVRAQLTEVFQGKFPDKVAIGLDTVTPPEAGSWEMRIKQGAPRVDMEQGNVQAEALCEPEVVRSHGGVWRALASGRRRL